MLINKTIIILLFCYYYDFIIFNFFNNVVAMN